MASQTPFIATKVGGIPEIITNEKTGLLISPKNSAEISQAILHLKNYQVRQKITANAFKLVKQQFTIKTICKKTEELYEKILR